MTDEKMTEISRMYTDGKITRDEKNALLAAFFAANPITEWEADENEEDWTSCGLWSNEDEDDNDEEEDWTSCGMWDETDKSYATGVIEEDE